MREWRLPWCSGTESKDWILGVSTGASSSEPSQMSKETKKNLDEDANKIEEPK